MENEGIFVVIAKSVAIQKRSVGSCIPKFATKQTDCERYQEEGGSINHCKSTVTRRKCLVSVG
jgi:hypothetical protein